MALDVEVRDGKTLARLEDLSGWEDNPRRADDQEIERLKRKVDDLGLYKPLIVDTGPTTPDGTVIGGNMRIQALEDLGEEWVWVSLVECEDEDEVLEYALSDNDRVGHYDEDQMATLVSRADIDITDYKVDFYAPTDITQDLAQAMDPEDVIELAEGEGKSDDEDETPGVEAGESGSQDGDEPTPREMEGLGERSSTAMVQLFMAKDQKEQEFLPAVAALKQAWNLDNTSDVVHRAVTEAADAAADDSGGVTPEDVEAE